MATKRYFLIICVMLFALVGTSLQANNEAKHWATHFAYNSVQQIALDDHSVYAVANGKLFSIHQLSEQLTLYNNFSGMHGTDIAQIAYDSLHQQKLIVYTNGKIDVWLSQGNMHYVPDLYNKQMTESKMCNNITLHGHTAYLSMDFGILTFDLQRHEIVDTYYIGDQAQAIKVLDVMIQGDMLYAQTEAGTMAANIHDNVVDYRYWHPVSGISFDANKGRQYTANNGDTWRVAGNKGVERRMLTGGTTYYLPDGPLVNTPYAMTAQGGRVFVVAGGRWVNQNRTPGDLMIWDNRQWHNTTSSQLQAANGKKPVLDFTSVAVDPNDPTHYFIASYGTGLFEFRDDKLYNNYKPSNSIIAAAAPDNPDRYTRTDALAWDADGCLWVCVAGGVDTSLVCILPDGTQRGLNLYPNGDKLSLSTPGGLLIDGDMKWLVSCRADAGIAVLHDGGTKWDMSDDRSVWRKEWLDQDGQLVAPDYYYGIAQAPDSSIWIATSSGPIIIDKDIDIMTSNQCRRLRIPAPDDNYLLETDRVNCFAWDDLDRLWIGSQSGGVYVLDTHGQQQLACYTSDNSAMPSNTVISLAWNPIEARMYIGTATGLVSYTQDVVDAAWNDTYQTNPTGSMYRWRAHQAFTYVDNVVKIGNKVYGLSAGGLFVVDSQTGMVSNMTKLDGLSASGINQIAKNETLNRMLITYQDGEIDIMDEDGQIYPIMDLYLKQMNGSKVVNDICIFRDKAYLAMNWGILVVNMRKAEIQDTYYIGPESSEVPVHHICNVGSLLYAMTDTALYCASIHDNLVDYAFWHTVDKPQGSSVTGMREFCSMLFMVVDGQLWRLQQGQWNHISMRQLRSIRRTADYLWLLPVKPDGIGRMPKTGSLQWFAEDMVCHCIAEDGEYYWIGTQDNGLVQYHQTKHSRQTYYPEGPCSNFAYKLRFAGDRLYMLPGGRWADRYKRKGDIMIYQDNMWRNIRNIDLRRMNQYHQVLDLMNVAQDPLDDNHYFVTSYGTGLYEMYEDSIIHTYLPDNSLLGSAVPESPLLFTRTDGITYDHLGNLWVLNVGGGQTKNIQILTPEGKWYAYQVRQHGKAIEMHTSGDILIDQRNPNHKWIPLLRYNTGLILLDDNGTPTNGNDDQVTYRTEFVDQNGNYLLPNEIHAVVQDKNNVIWIGTDDGILAIPPTIDFAESNRCVRVIIPRNDGTQLGDYLLDNEQIYDIQFDGANRLWVATANSGVYLLTPTMEDVSHPNYYVETECHFTTDNSILPSNEVLSIAIQRSTGEVFFATGGGLVSYMSDASEPEANYSSIYAYPNPVRPDYEGYITFTGLMDDTQLRIVDASGSLVRVIQSNGGTATWDGCNTQGQRVGTGVYTALCNTIDGKAHGVTKVLIIN